MGVCGCSSHGARGEDPPMMLPRKRLCSWRRKWWSATVPSTTLSGSPLKGAWWGTAREVTFYSFYISHSHFFTGIALHTKHFKCTGPITLAYFLGFFFFSKPLHLFNRSYWVTTKIKYFHLIKTPPTIDLHRATRPPAPRATSVLNGSVQPSIDGSMCGCLTDWLYSIVFRTEYRITHKNERIFYSTRSRDILKLEREKRNQLVESFWVGKYWSTHEEKGDV